MTSTVTMPLSMAWYSPLVGCSLSLSSFVRVVNSLWPSALALFRLSLNCCNIPFTRLGVKAFSASALSDCLSGLHPRQSQGCGCGPGQGRVSGAGHQPGRREGAAGHLDRPDRRRQVLAASRERIEEPRRAAYLHRLRRWTQGLPSSSRIGCHSVKRKPVYTKFRVLSNPMIFIIILLLLSYVCFWDIYFHVFIGPMLFKREPNAPLCHINLALI